MFLRHKLYNRHVASARADGYVNEDVVLQIGREKYYRKRYPVKLYLAYIKSYEYYLLKKLDDIFNFASRINFHSFR